MVAAWHREPGERFDFSAGPQRLEVKSSSSRQREHAFSLEQITPTGGLRIAVASVFVERIGGGLSVRELFGETRNLVSSEPELVTRFDTVFFSSLGSSWADAMDERFDWELATESILYYGAESVPRPENRTPQSVFDVRFRAQLGSVAPLGIGDLDNSGGLFAAAVPAQSKNS